MQHTKQTARKIREALEGTGLEKVFNKWLLDAFLASDVSWLF